MLHLYGEVHPDHGGVNRDQSLDGQRQYQAVHVRQGNPDASRKRHIENIPTNRFYRRIVDIANRLVDPQPESAQSAQIEDPNREGSVVEIESQGPCKALDVLMEQSSCLGRSSHEANDPCDQGAGGQTSQKGGSDVSPCADGANSDQGHVRAAKVPASLHVLLFPTFFTGCFIPTLPPFNPAAPVLQGHTSYASTTVFGPSRLEHRPHCARAYSTWASLRSPSSTPNWKCAGEPTPAGPSSIATTPGRTFHLNSASCADTTTVCSVLQSVG